MRTKILNEVKHKHNINSEKKSCKVEPTVPDEQNKDFCLNCKIDVKECKGSKHCVGFKKEKENG